ncbi:tRNA adenosine(34) deaminase TadA [Candidatus Tremblaya phenacola]|uniref:tRNA-specific adenosine deaminase n=1 Tax=Candidatus Tremblayella phenacoccinincola TaxID=1010676 RepID=A0A2G0V716_9PROT|nr:tRNA adenosine(34) deaminase TadA [Candidatus Tremblaya phenacola]PHN16265.1 tRNA-specific adenosine deaminase [Candidatus Tremblaya phenacola]
MWLFDRDAFWMKHAINLAERAAYKGEVPIGAVLVLNDVIVGEGWNSSIYLNDPTAHAEVLALRTAGKLIKTYRFLEAVIYVTLEPCLMCLGSIIHARVSRIIYGANDNKVGAVRYFNSLRHYTNIRQDLSFTSGVLQEECSLQLTKLFRCCRS